MACNCMDGYVNPDVCDHNIGAAHGVPIVTSLDRARERRAAEHRDDRIRALSERYSRLLAELEQLLARSRRSS